MCSRRPPRVLLVHNRYRDRAGEDASFDGDRRVLMDHGVDVVDYIRDNREIAAEGGISKLSAAAQTTWSSAARSEVARLIRDRRPDIVHFHNTFPLISPAAYWACRDAEVPVVQTLRNFRPFCSHGLFYRDGHICTDCVGRMPVWPGVLHGCYRNSRLQSSAVALMQTTHQFLKTWTKKVDAYVVASDFTRKKLIECGLPADRIHVKPNVVDIDVEPDPGAEGPALFVGRLVREKGILTLLRAWTALPQARLEVVGDGPDRAKAERLIDQLDLGDRVRLLGPMNREDVLRRMAAAWVVVVPSEAYETFGRVPVEAFGCGTPVIASRLGALADVVEHDLTGLQFSAGDPNDLAAAVSWGLENRREMTEMARRARATYEARYAPSAAFDSLIKIYEYVLGLSVGKARGRSGKRASGL